MKLSDIEIISLNTVIVGSGAAGFNAAGRLYDLGQKNIAIVTEGRMMGTSRNTGSDKQTYYKLSQSGDTPDSARQMAKDLFKGGAMDGDIALVEAALSTRCFYKLVEIGVPFPHNSFGEFVGYKTDHDDSQRATSAGPLTSKFMTEKLEEQVMRKGIKLYEGYTVIGVLTHKNICRGIMTINPQNGFTLYNCKNVIYATGGPAGLYSRSVYPPSQTGATGWAFEVGVKGKNLTEWQYGIASTKFRWNLSGTYQQVLPRYISTDMNGGDERELDISLDNIFLKGYQWPFDPKKVKGSSMVDVLVHKEMENRRVFLDYSKNPSSLKDDFSNIGEEAFNYLKNSNALFGTPIDRLNHMNSPAVELYKNNRIDLYKDYLEIAVCAQHNNGGLAANHYWESNIQNFFPVGEVCATHGVYRPGGSALNSGQVGSTRAAQYIAANYQGEPPKPDEFINMVAQQVENKINIANSFKRGSSNVLETRKSLGDRMSSFAAHIRTKEGTKRVADEAKADLEKTVYIKNDDELAFAFSNINLLIAQYTYAKAMEDYIDKGYQSRGSYLIDKGGLSYDIEGEGAASLVQEVEYGSECSFTWRKVRPIPSNDDWFENVWNKFMKGDIYG